MSDTDQRIESAVQMLERDTQLTHDITHGDETSVVQTEGGPVPSHKKVATDGYQYFVNELRPRVADINQHAKLVTDSASEANNARNEAVKAKNDAVKVVHNDEGSLTPKPGAYAVADSNGHYDIGWTPHLAALYPYSGVMGSVSKSDLFFCSAIAGWENRFRFANTRPRFNIAGKIVDIGYPFYIDLSEAESTPDRAVAFDDVFLDWNGNVTTFRSITPHRTATGYDRDAIASEHRYSKADAGLYKKGDSYSLLLCRVARRNKGAYHPVWNPEGTINMLSPSGTAWTSADRSWHGSDIRTISSKSDCFDFAHSPSNGAYRGKVAPIESGSIGYHHGSDALGRPDKKCHNAIYVDDITPLYLSAERVQDRQALLFDSFNRAVAGETFSGAEGLNQNGLFEVDLITSQVYIRLGALESEPGLPLGESAENKPISYDVLNLRSTKTYTISRVALSSSNHRMILLDAPLDEFQVGDKILVKEVKKLNLWNTSYVYPSASPKFLAVDIIGSLDAMPPEWKTSGIPGNWVAVGEEEESLIPDGTPKNFKLSRKCLECYLVLQSSDKGKTWVNGHSDWKTGFESSANARQHNTLGSEFLIMVFYRAAANPFDLYESSTQQTYTSFSFAHATQNAHKSQSEAVFCNFMIDKTPIAPKLSQSRFPITNYAINSISKGVASTSRPSHLPIIWQDSVDKNSPTLKVIPFLVTGSSMNFNLGVFYKELKYNSESWGDDNQFNIVDYQSTVTDNNGQKVIVGQKRVELPYQFDGVTL